MDEPTSIPSRARASDARDFSGGTGSNRASSSSSPCAFCFLGFYWAIKFFFSSSSHSLGGKNIFLFPFESLFAEWRPEKERLGFLGGIKARNRNLVNGSFDFSGGEGKLDFNGPVMNRRGGDAGKKPNFLSAAHCPSKLFLRFLMGAARDSRLTKKKISPRKNSPSSCCCATCLTLFDRKESE